MLLEIVEYGKRQGLPGPGFTPKTVKWAIQATIDGRLMGIVPLGDTSSKRHQGREFAVCPETSGMNSGGKSHFLVETLETVLLMCKDEERRPAYEAKHAFFVRQLRDTVPVCPEMGIFADLIDDEAHRARMIEELQQAKAKPTDKITLMIEGRDPPFLVDDTIWHDWWADYRKTLGKASGDEAKPKARRSPKKSSTLMRCFVTGELVEPAATHPKITELADVGARAEALLVSFDKDSLCSYGLSQSANAAMSEESAAGYRAALNHILADRGHRLAGAKVAYWFDKKVPEEHDPGKVLFSLPDEDSDGKREERDALAKARELLDAIRKGEAPAFTKNNHYYALTLSGNGGRVVIRDWMAGPFEELLENILDWFKDTAIALLDSESAAQPLRFEQILTSCLDQRPPSQSYADWVKPANAYRDGLWRAAIGGRTRPIPRGVIERVVLRHSAMMLKRLAIEATDRSRNDKSAPKTGGSKAYPRYLLYARMAVMRAYCNRFSRIHHKGDYTVDTALNVNHPRTAYHIGRLMAVLEMIQTRAQGQVGATIAQTNYASAATRPLTSLPRLESLVQHHLPKIGDAELRKAYYDLLMEINSKIRDGIPRSFDLEDQCLFHLGYYHQRPYRPYSQAPHRHLTINGEKVRSKSEVIVANLLKALGIKYKYEESVYFKDGEVSVRKPLKGDGVIVRHPDFTLLETRDGRNVFIEHQGMMDNYLYRHDWGTREHLFRTHGILSFAEGGGPNGTYILTTEKGGVIDCQELVKTLDPFCPESVA